MEKSFLFLIPLKYGMTLKENFILSEISNFASDFYQQQFLLEIILTFIFSNFRKFLLLQKHNFTEETVSFVTLTYY